MKSVVVALAFLAPAAGLAAAPAQSFSFMSSGKYYTFDPSPAHGGVPATPWPTTVYDASLHQRVIYKLNRGGGGYVRGEDTLTGRQWHADVFVDGGIKGRDLDGADWIYQARTRTYLNETSGRRCAQTSLLHVCPA